MHGFSLSLSIARSLREVLVAAHHPRHRQLSEQRAQGVESKLSPRRLETFSLVRHPLVQMEEHLPLFLFLLFLFFRFSHVQNSKHCARRIGSLRGWENELPEEWIGELLDGARVCGGSHGRQAVDFQCILCSEGVFLLRGLEDALF